MLVPLPRRVRVCLVVNTLAHHTRARRAPTRVRAPRVLYLLGANMLQDEMLHIAREKRHSPGLDGIR
tara:strand:- start:433 stop:633 length:201 start_codon:yes stop_codon:yes gene_type:complete